MSGKCLLLIGTADTKADELDFLRAKMQEQGVAVQLMDVGVLGNATCAVDISSEQVAHAANTTLDHVRNCGDENQAMLLMAQGAASLAIDLLAECRIHGMLALGGTMGTDLALDVAQALPLGVPKVVISTVAHSHLIAPERISPDLIMVLWAGGLYGLNDLCKSALAQAAGAAAGAVRAALPPSFSRPLIGMTSLGKSCLSYMVRLKPALEARGYDVAVFHTTGMGGRAFEALAAAGRFAAVLDLSVQELANHVGGSCVTAGADRLLGAGRAGVPQIVAPGAADMIDFPAWQPVPEALAARAVHVHNRLIASATSPPELRRKVAHEMMERLNQAQGPTHLLLPLHGVEAWDLPGEPLHDATGLQAFIDTVRAYPNPRFVVEEVAAHINEEAYAERVLSLFDSWVAQGRILPGAAA